MGPGRETNHKRLLISGNKLRVAGCGRGDGGDWVAGLLGRVCAMVSAVKCVRLMIHRPVYVNKKKNSNAIKKVPLPLFL